VPGVVPGEPPPPEPPDPPQLTTETPSSANPNPNATRGAANRHPFQRRETSSNVNANPNAPTETRYFAPPVGLPPRGEKGTTHDFIVVPTVKVKGTAVAPLIWTDGADNAHDVFNGTEPQFAASPTLPVKPAVPWACRLKTADWPAATVIIVGAPAGGAKENPTPVPFNATTCGLPNALSVTVTDPVREPMPVGEKVTESEQLAAAASDAPQVFVSPKSPLALIEAIVNELVPLFISVTGCAALIVPTTCELNCKLPGESVATGPLPVPVSGTICGELPTLSVMVNCPLRAPEATGVKTTAMVQAEFAGTLGVHVLVCEKSPVVAMLLKTSGPLPPFVTVTVWLALGLPIACDENCKLVGATVTVGTVPVPVSGTATVPPAAAVYVTVKDPVAGPAAVGEKETLTVQLPPAGIPAAQVFVSENPVDATTAATGIVCVLAFEIVTFCAGLVLPTSALKVKPPGLADTGTICIFARKPSEQGAVVQLPPL
jgi:hypothetical protein